MGTLQHRLERAQVMEKQRIGLEQIKARHEAKQLADAQAKAHRAEMLRRLSSEVSAVETQHKARVAAAKAALDAARAAKAPVSPPQPVSELSAAAPAAVPAQANPAVSRAFWQNLPPHMGAQMQDAMRNMAEQQKKQAEVMRMAQQARSSPPAAESSTNATQRDQAQMARQEQDRINQSAVPSPAPTQAPVEVEAEVRPVTVEDVVDEEDIKPEAKSTMIFPKLDKESPVSSTADVSAAMPPAPPSEISAAKSEKSELEIFEDAESVSFVDSSDEEEGFMTDEEYDILDASDEELAA